MGIRNPKSEIRENSEGRDLKAASPACRVFGFRASGFFRISDFGFRIPTWAVVSLFILALPLRSHAAESYAASFRVGFSSNTFSDANENDAKAAVKVWAQMLAKEQKLPVEPEPQILKGVEAMSQALRRKLVDAVALPVDEYWKLREQMDPRIFIGGLNEGKITEEYVLLVHQDSTIKRIEDLRGARLACWQNSRMSLAPVWLDTVLLQGGCSRATEFCRVSQVSRLSKAILPVFFRQADTCLVTRRGFKNMGELNPQVVQRLKVLASSPELVPSGFCFRHDYNDPLRETIVKELQQIMSRPAGAQVLTLFQSGALVVQPVSCLNSALEMLAKHERLCGGTNQLRAAGAKVQPGDMDGGGM